MIDTIIPKGGGSNGASSPTFGSPPPISPLSSAMPPGYHALGGCHPSAAVRAMARTAAGSSPSAVFTALSSPHFVHLWMMRGSVAEPSMRIGRIWPPHSSALSPGFTSTCLLQRHFGQWLVYPFPRTKNPHCSQVKSSLVLWNFFVEVI